MWVMPSNPGVSYLSALAGIRKSTLVVVMPLIKSEDKAASGEGSIWSPACSGPEPQGSAPRRFESSESIDGLLFQRTKGDKSFKQVRAAISGMDHYASAFGVRG
jgi:hypothetical protein